MFYIITYATHSENYFNLLKTYPQLIILGYGTKWNGFKDKADAIVSFCKKIKSDDIVCCVDGFDTIILESSSEILKRFKELNKKLIFSKDCNYDTLVAKYGQDKIFGSCNNKRLSAGLYIGKASSIIDVWKDLKTKMDDQRFITQKCINGVDIYIDDTNYIFYNYSPIDKIKIINKKIYINDNSFHTCILGAPGNSDIKIILEKLGYKNINLIKKNKKRVYYVLKTYFSKFIPEIILLLSLIFIFIFFGFNHLITYFIAFFLISVFLEIFIKITFLNISNKKKILYTILDIIHVFILISFIYIVTIMYLDIFKLKCNIKLILFLNLYLLIIFFLFFIFKRCILSILSDKIIKENTPWKDPVNRLKYIYNKKELYFNKKNKNTNNTFLWMNGNIFLIFLIIFLNIYFLIMLHLKKCNRL